jgi:hypothetical protein
MINIIQEQRNFSNRVVDRYGQDQSGTVTYRFNAQGFRSEADFNYPPDLVFFGGSTPFGVGVPIEQTFPHVVAKEKNLKIWNCSYACVKYNNQDFFDTISLVHQEVKNIPIVVQWVSDKYDPLCTVPVYTFIEQTKKLYPDSVHMLIDSLVEKDKILSGYFDLVSPPFIDKSASTTQAGPKTHQLLSKFLIKKLV